MAADNHCDMALSDATLCTGSDPPTGSTLGSATGLLSHMQHVISMPACQFEGVTANQQIRQMAIVALIS